MGIRLEVEYLKYVVKHKYYVFIECCKLGIPVLGALHDLHKFTYSEIKGFENYDEDLFILDAAGIFHLAKFATKRADRAWAIHKRVSKHHWQYWVMPDEDIPGRILVSEMPMKYRKEMLADWRGAAKASGNEVGKWYEKFRDRIILGPKTRDWIDERMNYYG